MREEMMEIRRRHDGHRDKSEPVTKFFIIKQHLPFSYNRAFYRKFREKGS